ncbi:MAG: hypothetical protein KBG62_01175, partial [Propionivibrio sp.]|nr:hypothetical protein [Propionivibrio sp.]
IGVTLNMDGKQGVLYQVFNIAGEMRQAFAKIAAQVSRGFGEKTQIIVMLASLCRQKQGSPALF